VQGWHAELEVAPGEDDDVPEGQGWHVELEVALVAAEKVPGRGGKVELSQCGTEPLGDVVEGCFDHVDLHGEKEQGVEDWNKREGRGGAGRGDRLSGRGGSHCSRRVLSRLCCLCHSQGRTSRNCPDTSHLATYQHPRSQPHTPHPPSPRSWLYIAQHCVPNYHECMENKMSRSAPRQSRSHTTQPHSPAPAPPQSPPQSSRGAGRGGAPCSQHASHCLSVAVCTIPPS